MQTFGLKFKAKHRSALSQTLSSLKLKTSQKSKNYKTRIVQITKNLNSKLRIAATNHTLSIDFIIEVCCKLEEI